MQNQWDSSHNKIGEEQEREQQENKEESNYLADEAKQSIANPAPMTAHQQDHQQQEHHQEQGIVSSMSGSGKANGLVDTDVLVAQGEILQNDGNFGMIPLPQLERTTANNSDTQTQPGAFPSGDFPAIHESSETTTEITHIEPGTEALDWLGFRPPTIQPTIQPENDNGDLAVANLVQDETIPQDLPEAQDYNPDNINNSRETRMKEFKTKVLLGVIALLAIILIFVAILTPQSQEDNADIVPTTSPISTILEDQESPQSRAFEWLMEEVDILHNLTEQRVVQRFVLATFYFANSDGRWFLSDNWLNHSVHECLWHSSLEQWYFTFDARINFPLDHISPCEQEPAGYLNDGVLYQGDGILKNFWLQYNGLSGSGIPPELYLLTDLKSVALDNFKLTTTIPEELFNLPSLEVISMISCDLYGSIPEAIGRLSKLRIIYFALNSLTGTIPSSLYSLTNSMRSMYLLDNQLTGPLPTTELGLLPDLQFIWFAENLFTGTIPTELGELNLLYWLDLGGLVLSGTIPAELEVQTDMIFLQLYDSGLTGTIPGWLGNMTNMKVFTLRRNSFTGTIPTELGLLTELSSLWLGGNALSGTIPTEIGMYEQVLALSFENTDLIGTIPTELGQLTHGLWQLLLHDNDLTGTVPLELGNVSFLATRGKVLLHGNDLSGIIPESLCSVNNLTFDCSSQLCGCDWCNCSNAGMSMVLLEVENQTNGDGQFVGEENQTST
ncbi:LRR receptor-like serine threonine-protein kinase [Seminavis robusta]|uniref:LRR receptor-like serine threonine-protein kinase n=1 Tax=Seminavis robusta TaxID=568900 RepID=A0A9N8DPS1_9STRA|nr:LRR receptor-like serine threonine-protein kinase [Seminavis robusta]|eukprot:Sro283_g107780.1 LRR receptor-like serine threonine-protein kinase (726) ;mRNA; f:54419-57010